jgi:hypothetical protein
VALESGPEVSVLVALEWWEPRFGSVRWLEDSQIGRCSGRRWTLHTRK